MTDNSKNSAKFTRTKESDSPNEAGSKPSQIRPEVAKSAQTDARGMQEIENTRTNKYSGSASELERQKRIEDKASLGVGAEEDSFIIDAVDEAGKKFVVASRVSGGTEHDYKRAQGDKAEKAEKAEKAGKEAAFAVELSEQPKEKFHTHELKAIQTDESLPADKRTLAGQLQDMRIRAKESNQPTAEIDRFASEAFKKEIQGMRGSYADEAGTFQAISNYDLAEHALPQSEPRHLDEDGRPIVDHQLEQMDKKTFSLGLTYTDLSKQ